MPYKIVKLADGKYKVVNSETGTVHAERTTKAKAEAQVRLLTELDTKPKKKKEKK